MDEDKKKKKKEEVEKMDIEKVEEKEEKHSTEKIDDSKEKSLKKETAEEEAENTPEEKEKMKKFIKQDSEEEKEEEKDEKKKKKKHEEGETKAEEKKEHKSEEKKEMADDGIEFSLKGPAYGTRSEQRVEMADNSSAKAPILETADSVYAQKYKSKLLQELADSYVQFNKSKSREEAMGVLQGKSIEQLEIYQDAFSGITMKTQQTSTEIKVKPIMVTQDNNNHVARKFANEVPEFGGVGHEVDMVQEVADMTPETRRKTFGEYGSFDLCFNPQNAQKYRKNK